MLEDRTKGPPSEDSSPESARGVKVCGQCASRFSGDARFCPFDGEPLKQGFAADAPDLLIGTVVDDRYEVESLLGEGGMGTVYRAKHRVIERPFALKVLRADSSRDSELGVRFMREARAAASISHPNVVQITDFGDLPTGQPYFVMELLTGRSLSALLRKGGPLPAARAVRLLTQIVEALSAAHSAGVVHRDLKPDNVLVCPSGGREIVKVLDFGLAKVAGQSRLTKAGLVFGTPHYMSPEQASGGVVDERTDIYSLGVVMYEMFTGRVPFEADTYMGVLTKHLYVAPTPPSVHLGNTAELGALEQVTLRCLEKKPERRYASMTAVASELRRLARFTEDGSFTVARAELREPRTPLLADELELPSRAELGLAMKRLRASEQKPLGLTMTTLGLCGVVVAAAVGIRSFAGPTVVVSKPETPPSPSAPAAPLTKRLAPVPTPSVAVRTPISTDVGIDAPAEPAAPPASPQKRPRSRPARPSAPEAETADKVPINKDKALGSEIVDPWSRSP